MGKYMFPCHVYIATSVAFYRIQAPILFDIQSLLKGGSSSHIFAWLPYLIIVLVTLFWTIDLLIQYRYVTKWQSNESINILQIDRQVIEK